MLRSLFGLLLAASPFFAYAQTAVQEIDLSGATALHIEASFSSVSVTTGGAEVISLNHVLTTDGEDRPDLRELEVIRENGSIRIRELKPTVKTLKKEFPRYEGGHLRGDRWHKKGTFNGAVVKAVMEVVVPPGVDVTVSTEYGSILATNVPGLREARATYGSVDIIFTGNATPSAMDLFSNYGAVDVTLPAGQSVDLDLTTQYGELLTDLEIDVNPDASQEKNFFQRVVGKVGKGGVTLKCKAPYGNIYLREAKSK